MKAARAKKNVEGSGWQLPIIKANFQRATKSLKVSNVIDLQCFLSGVESLKSWGWEAFFFKLLLFKCLHHCTINLKALLQWWVSHLSLGRKCKYLSCRFIAGRLTNIFAVVFTERRSVLLFDPDAKKSRSSTLKTLKMHPSLCQKILNLPLCDLYTADHYRKCDFPVCFTNRLAIFHPWSCFLWMISCRI